MTDTPQTPDLPTPEGLIELASKATPRPWVPQRCDVTRGMYLVAGAWPIGSTICEVDSKNEQANAAFITLACNLAPSLAERVLRLEAWIKAHEYCGRNNAGEGVCPDCGAGEGYEEHEQDCFVAEIIEALKGPKP